VWIEHHPPIGQRGLTFVGGELGPDAQADGRSAEHGAHDPDHPWRGDRMNGPAASLLAKRIAELEDYRRAAAAFSWLA
jgi:hypothetical protein